MIKKNIIFLILTLIIIIPSYLISQNQDKIKEEQIRITKQKIEEIKSKAAFIKNPVKEYIEIAHLYLDIEDYENSTEYFNRALTFDPSNANIHYMLAMIYEKKNNRIKAIESWKNVIKFSRNKKMIEIAEKHIEILSSEK